MEYVGDIEGRIISPRLKTSKRLMEQKKVISQVAVCEVYDRYDTFLYSWGENKIASDKWSEITEPEHVFKAKDTLINKMELPVEISDDIIKHMEENEALLATLDIYSDDNQHNRTCTCLIGMDGKPITDLIYISTTYEVKTIPLKKDRIGEVDEIKEELQERMNMKALAIQDNKQRLGANFLQSMGLAIEENKREELEDSYLGEDK